MVLLLAVPAEKDRMQQRCTEDIGNLRVCVLIMGNKQLFTKFHSP